MRMRFTYRASRITILPLLFAICLLLSSCAMPGDAAQVIKIGVIAPFEGMGRPLGYAVLPGIKAAVEEANASGDLGRYRVLVVAFNDDLDASTAAAQAQALALDPDVMAVVGPWSPETAAAVTPILAEADLPAVVCDRRADSGIGREVGVCSVGSGCDARQPGCSHAAGRFGRRYPGARPAHALRGGCRAEEPLIGSFGYNKRRHESQIGEQRQQGDELCRVGSAEDVEAGDEGRRREEEPDERMAPAENQVRQSA